MNLWVILEKNRYSLCADHSLFAHVEFWGHQGELALTIMGIDGEITPHVMAKLSALSVRVCRCLVLAVFVSAEKRDGMFRVDLRVLRMAGDIGNATHQVPPNGCFSLTVLSSPLYPTITRSIL